MVDGERLRSLLDRLDEELGHLRRLAASGETLLTDPDAMAGVKYRFVVAIEVCIDAGQHVISSERLRTPTDFADVFAVLSESGFVKAELLPSLQDMARFRNLLVHVYERVDDRQVVKILETRLSDLEAFRKQIAAAASM